MRQVLAPLLAVTATLAGCHEPSARLNAPPHGYADKTVDSQGTLVYMSDNAALSDMTVSDMHFLPHRAKLTTLGRERVARLAQLVETHGGTIRLSSDLTDESLVNQRLEVVRDYLAKSGMSVNPDTVVLDIPGGEGMRSTDAIAIRNESAKLPASKAGPAKPGAGASSGGGTGGGSGGGGASESTKQ